MNKEAVVFILDANPTMNAPYPKVDRSVKSEEDEETGEKRPTRLDCAKKALVAMISSLMLQTKTNEVAVIVCKTAGTQHHKIAAGVDIEEEYGDDLPFPNLTELTDGLVRPGVELLRRISQVETASAEEAQNFRGDLCDAIILAADAHYEYGLNKSGKTFRKFRRKIVLITDAEHDIIMDTRQLLTVVDSLRSMGCSLEVIGLEFSKSFDFAEPLPAERAAANVKQEDAKETGDSNKKLKVEEGDDGDAVVKKDESATDDESNEDEEMSGENGEEETERVYSSKDDREELIGKLTELTGGQVVAASTMQEILDANKGKRVTRSVRNKFEFRIAPGLIVEARSALLMQAVSFSSAFGKIDDRALVVDAETHEKVLDDDGNEQFEKIIKKFHYVDEDQPDVFYSKEDVTYADQYGSSLVPISDFDREGLKTPEGKPYLQILGYMKRDKIPSVYVSGDPSVISGCDSRKACAAVSALAQALDRQQKVAVGTFLKRTNASKKNLVALFPLPEPDYPHPMHLVVMEIPYGDEVKHLTLDSLDELLQGDQEEVKAKVCDEFIDALMLPDGVLGSGDVPSPLVRSSNQTKLEKAMDHSAEVVKVRPRDGDPMVTPSEVLKRAQSTVEAFEETFPLETTKKDGKEAKKGRNGRKILTYKNYVS